MINILKQLVRTGTDIELRPNGYSNNHVQGSRKMYFIGGHNLTFVDICGI